jgi:glyoxylase-like metal-dependent hydrolase (beta-lactamase superfamily II)
LGTYSYVLASRRDGRLVDLSGAGQGGRYLRLTEELELNLVKAVDTHLHADYITAVGALPRPHASITVMGEQSKADVVSIRVTDGEQLRIGRHTCLGIRAVPH